MTTSTFAERRAAARARQDAAEAEARRRRVVLQIGALVVAGLLLVIVVAVALAWRGGDEPAAGGQLVVPANATADGVISVGDPDAPVAVSVVFDYMCPFCGRFETANNGELDRLLDSGEVRVDLRPLSFLDAQSAGSAYSTRTANALATVADGAPDHVWAFHRALFEQQPEEGTSGPTDEQLAQTARDVGVPDAVAERLDDDAFAAWVADVTQQAFEAGVTGTPTVLVDGEVFTGDLYSPGPLTEAVRAAAIAP